MSDIRDFTGKNRRFTGTDSIKLPSGSTAERVGSIGGEIRFNSTLNLAEYYDGTNWKAIDAPPTISSVQVDSQTAAVTNFIAIGAGGTSTILINGSLFDTTNGSVTIAPQGTGSNVTPVSLTRTSASQFSLVVTRSDFTSSGSPYDLTITNGSNLSATLAGAFTANVAPAFSTAADTVVSTSLYAGASAPFSETTLVATDADGDAVTHTVTAGSLPSGVTLGTNGVLAGTVASSTEGEYTFTVTATDANGQTAARQFKLRVVAAHGDAEYTSGGTYTWTVPAGVFNASVVCIGAGGAAGIGNSGQAGGGGGLAYRNSISVTPGTTGTVVVGAAQGRSGNVGNAGGDSSFTYGTTTTTAEGGGGGFGDGAGTGGSGGAGGAPQGTYDGGGSGGAGGTDPANVGAPGGGGAGGYSGNGGQGGATTDGTAQNGQAGSGGGGGGGGKAGQTEIGSGGGGGVGFYGQGSNGAGGIGFGQASTTVGTGGGGGSGGTSGAAGNPTGPGGSGGNYGGGNGGSQVNIGGGNGGGGAVRIVWHPSGATFPSTNVSNP